MIPVIRPAAGGSPEAIAMPMHKGNATKKTMIDGRMSPLNLWLLIGVMVNGSLDHTATRPLNESLLTSPAPLNLGHLTGSRRLGRTLR